MNAAGNTMAGDDHAIDDAIEQLGRSAALYNSALEHARRQSFDTARDNFEALLVSTPQLEKAWISYAQVHYVSAHCAWRWPARLSQPARPFWTDVM
jgi:outer membrane protein assembly factor BamD (BamD/ComL family)